MDGHDGQHVVLYKRLCCVSGPVRLTIIADKFKRTEMISSTLSDYSEIKLELYNRKKKKGWKSKSIWILNNTFQNST